MRDRETPDPLRAAAPTGRPVRLLHLSDVHFGAENTSALAAVAAFAANLKPDAVIVAGDITQHGARREFRTARAWLDSLQLRVIATPGNHDTPAVHLAHHLPRRLVAPFSLYRQYMGELDSCGQLIELDGGMIAITGLNTARGVQGRINWADGVIRLADLEDALSLLRSVSSATVHILACHHPLREPGHSLISVDTRRGREALRRCAAAHVDVILTGHIHDAFAHPVHSAGHRLVQMGSGTLSTRLRGTHPSFCVLTVQGGSVRQDVITVGPDGLVSHCNYDSLTHEHETLYQPGRQASV